MANGNKRKDAVETSGMAKEAMVPVLSAMYPWFNHENFGIWVATMECTLEVQGLYDAVDPGGDELKKGGSEYRKDRQALTVIYSVMPMDIMQH